MYILWTGTEFEKAKGVDSTDKMSLAHLWLWHHEAITSSSLWVPFMTSLPGPQADRLTLYTPQKCIGKTEGDTFCLWCWPIESRALLLCVLSLGVPWYTLNKPTDLPLITQPVAIPSSASWPGNALAFKITQMIVALTPVGQQNQEDCNPTGRKVAV